MPATSAFDLEDWIGRRGLGWVAVVLLLFATAFFLKYAFENAWVGELGRVAIGVVFGCALSIAGYRYHVRGWRIFSQMLTAGGIVVFYLSTFAALYFYHLLPREQAGIFLVALIAEAAAVAVLYEAPAIAIMALIGGLLNPILLSTGHDQYRSLFTYLILLDMGAIGLVLFRAWPALASLALLGTQMLFWGWHGRWYHPEKLAAVLVFQSTLFALFLGHSLITHLVRSRRASIEDLVRMALVPVLFAIAGYVVLREDYHIYHILMGTLAVVMAMIYTAVAWGILRRRPDDQPQLLVATAIAMGFIAMAIPLQAEGHWIAVGWAVEAAALLTFGMRVRSLGMKGMGIFLFFIAIGRLFVIDTPEYLNSDTLQRLLPFLHPYGLAFLAVTACVWGVVVLGRAMRARLATEDHVLLILGAIAGIFLLWFILTLESYRYTSDFFGKGPAQTVLSVVWAVYAVVLLAVGFRVGSAALRWAALGLFGLTLAKVFLVDMSELQDYYRVAAFFGLSVMMAVAAWGYQRFQLGRLMAGPEVRSDEPR